MPVSIISNSSTIVVGGGVQASVNFIINALQDNENVKWHFIVSKVIDEHLKSVGINITDACGYVLDKSPAHNIGARREIELLVKKIAPNVLFTFFGPAYIKTEVPHLCGVADGWVTHSSRLAFSSLGNYYAKAKMLLLCLYKGYCYKAADRWVVEANCAKQGLTKRLKLPISKIDVVPNTYGKYYKRPTNNKKSTIGDVVNVLTLSSYYPHKNIEIIPLVAKLLGEMQPKIRMVFNITLDKGSPGAKAIEKLSKDMGVSENVVNIGPVSLIDGPSVYEQSDIVFLPSLLETSSANYPEAMIMGKPLVTCDLDFAHDICADAAVYYRPKDPLDAAKKINELIEVDEYRQSIIDNGVIRVSSFPDSNSRYTMYKDILSEMAGLYEH